MEENYIEILLNKIQTVERLFKDSTGSEKKIKVKQAMRGLLNVMSLDADKKENLQTFIDLYMDNVIDTIVFCVKSKQLRKTFKKNCKMCC
jgi:uncharacterized protein (UPF0335 family)